jgi:hypothetical protein
MKIKFIIIVSLFFIKGHGQFLNESDLVFIKNNILAYRIYHLAMNNPNYYQSYSSCALPQLSWDIKINYIRHELPIDFDGYKIFKIFNFNYKYYKIEEDRITVNTSECGFVEFSDEFIIGKKGNNILFISGMAFNDPIARFFNLNVENPESFYDFIYLKLHNYKFSNLKFKKIKKRKLHFECSSESLSDIKIEVDLKDYDKVKVIFPKADKIIYID